MVAEAQSLEPVPELVGLRFKPTDEELVNYYLKNKNDGNNSSAQNIAEVDLCRHEPWDLPRLSNGQPEDQEWFFFYPRANKGPCSTRTRRATGTGFWKDTGKTCEIMERGKVIGIRKVLVFRYKGRVGDSAKTDWVLHEYHPKPCCPDERIFVVGRLMDKSLERGRGRDSAWGRHQAEQPSPQLTEDDCDLQSMASRILSVVRMLRESL